MTSCIIGLNIPQDTPELCESRRRGTLRIAVAIGSLVTKASLGVEFVGLEDENPRLGRDGLPGKRGVIPPGPRPLLVPSTIPKKILCSL